MRLNKQKIGTQLRIGLGAVLLLVVFLGMIAWRQTESLWQETKGLYEHPLAVRRALGELMIDIRTMQQVQMALCLGVTDQERLALQQAIDMRDADAYKQFEAIYKSYLGPQKDIDEAFQAFVRWKAIREETRRLMGEGKSAEAVNRIKSGGICSNQVDKVFKEINDISDFAINKGDQFYQGAQVHKERMGVMIGLLFVAGLIAASMVFYYLLRGIKDPLKELTFVTDQYRRGKLDVRSSYIADNEFGALAASFNQLAESIQTELVVEENIAQLAAIMLREESLQSFCHELLKTLMQQTGSQVGAIYLLNERKTEFEHFDSVGIATGCQRASFSAQEHEGEFGMALVTRQIQRVTDIPLDTRMTFSTVSGDAVPREIITIPILMNELVVAVISLASVRDYTDSAVHLVEDVWSLVTARMNGVLTHQKLQAFSEKLEMQNRELESQKNELMVQTDELNEQNIELEMQKRQLDEANRLKSSFLSNMSHELRTPLNSVIALSGVLGRRLEATIPADEHGYIKVIERNGQHLLALINDILDLSRIESGHEKVNVCNFSLRELVAEVVAMIEPQLQGKSIALVNQVPSDIPCLTSDREKCRHILQNLVGNAVKFTEEGKVEINARRSDGEIHIAISDPGIGIEADKIPIIFDEFRQADDSTSRKYGGTGLGLAIVKKCVTLLDGSVAVESAPGKGSTFTVTLPLTLALPDDGVVEHYTPMAVAPVQSPSPTGFGKTILLVEDSEPAIIQITDILTQHGYQVQVARNGREAVEQIGRHSPDAMILDLMMPEVDGFHVLKTIRNGVHPNLLPVLILTAKHVTQEELSFLKSNHIHQLIQKGNVSKNELLAAVGRMVELHEEKPKRNKPPREQPIGKPILLVVEDNPDNMKTARALLEENYMIVEATDGREALAKARLHKPHLIMMDISLPVMDGIDTLAEIRKDEALSHIWVVAVTASAMKGNREEILAHGFDAYIAKPIDADLLHKTLQEMLNG